MYVICLISHYYILVMYRYGYFRATVNFLCNENTIRFHNTTIKRRNVEVFLVTANLPVQLGFLPFQFELHCKLSCVGTGLCAWLLSRLSITDHLLLQWTALQPACKKL